MKTFREYTELEVSELKIDKKSYVRFSQEAIKNINLLIEYGRKEANLDNKQLNPLLDAIKNIHTGEDAIRKTQVIIDADDGKNLKDDKKW